MSRVRSALLLLSLWPWTSEPLAQSSAQPLPGPADFAWQLPLTVSGNNGVVQFKLPLAVYQQSRMADLADLRLFDAQGAAVPFAWHRPGAERTATIRQSSVRMYPVYAAPGMQQAELELSVRASADGSLISLHTPATDRATDQPLPKLRALILDTGPAQTGEVLDSIQLLLPPELGNYQAVLSVAQSDDLKLWDALAQSRLDWLSASPVEAVALDHTTSSAARLVNDRIDFGTVVSRYLRIEWREGEPVQFAGVLAQWRGSRIAAEPLLELRLSERDSETVPGDWVYRSSPAIAATQIGLDLPTPNTVLPVQIGVYRSTLGRARDGAQRVQFVPHLQAVFYRLLRDGVERQSSRVSAPALATSEWVVRPQRQGEAAPDLVLRWAPRSLVFTARGTEFTLAVGSAAPVLRQLPGATAMVGVAPGYSADELARLEHASAGTASQPSSSVASTQLEREAPAGEPLLQRRVLMLWLALLGGVLVLGWMTWRLFTQMNRTDANKDDVP